VLLAGTMRCVGLGAVPDFRGLRDDLADRPIAQRTYRVLYQRSWISFGNSAYACSFTARRAAPLGHVESRWPVERTIARIRVVILFVGMRLPSRYEWKRGPIGAESRSLENFRDTECD
jgi:hypothetical protein